MRYDHKFKPVIPSGRIITTAKRNFANHIEDFLNKEIEDSKYATQQLQKIQTAGHFETEVLSPKQDRAIKNYKTKLEREFQLKTQQSRKLLMDFQQTVPFTVNSNTQFLVPPFDVEWHNSPGKADKDTGELSVAMLGGTGTLANALGIFLSSSTHVIAFLRALMPLEYNWGHVVFTHGFAGTSGGVGVLVYETNSDRIVLDRRSQLWNEGMWMSSTTTREGGARVYLSETNLAEVSFHMLPGSNYLVWYWIWIKLHTESLALVVASIESKIPIIVMNTIPAPVIR